MSCATSCAKQLHDVVDAEALLEPHEAAAFHRAIDLARQQLLAPQPLVFRWAGQVGAMAVYEIERGGEEPIHITTRIVGVQLLFWLLHFEAPLPLAVIGQSAGAARNAIRDRAAELFDRAGAHELARACLFVSATDGHLLYEAPVNAPRIEAIF